MKWFQSLTAFLLVPFYLVLLLAVGIGAAILVLTGSARLYVKRKRLLTPSSFSRR